MVYAEASWPWQARVLGMGWLRNITDILFGYDFFISYAHADGKDYPRALRDDLERSGFKVFLDEQDFGGGEELNIATRRRIRMSTKLILLARPRALDTSNWVCRELELFIQTKRDPIILNFDDAIAKAPTDRPIMALLQNRHRFPEIGNIGRPSGAIRESIDRTFDGVRQETRRIRALGASAIVFLIVAVVALWQWYEAEVQSRVSEAMTLDALAAKYFSEAARIESIWDRETARLADLEAEAALVANGPSLTGDGELSAMSPAETALRLENLGREMTELSELRNGLVNQARSERSAGKLQLSEARAGLEKSPSSIQFGNTISAGTDAPSPLCD
ncbi:MAG: toll/interleukin-1 receptor domain-containing protein [Rhodospirillaceae bacterium]|nr:toll/interleukin-1 receptor domain-containing protein [Rhodospirillaceae bacterium]